MLPIQPDTVYQTADGRLVSFGKTQIQLGIKYDGRSKHLKAIEKSEVSPKGNIGLVPSQKEEYELKSKVLGKGGDIRFHGKFVLKKVGENEQLEQVLYFPGLMTNH